ncbi:hypothetical protein JHK87_023117 [Glycine soja]|nr:hypothetical protein JHK87_023117 [Glycine soja]
MDEALCSYIEKDRPFLGICLGLQLLFESSEENGPVKGLGLIPGTVGRFDSSNGFRVPHIGWNALQITKDLGILDDVGNYHVYFVHSYRAMPSDDNNEWISSTYVGLSILRRFLNPKSNMAKVAFIAFYKPGEGKASKLAKRVRNLSKPVDIAGQYYKEGADEVSFLNITGFRDFPLGDLPMLQVKTGKTSLEQISRVYGNLVT